MILFWGVSMKKSVWMKAGIGIIILVGVVFAGVFFLISSCANSLKVNVMNFDQELNLKKPAEVKTKPIILFLGNSMTYVNDLPTVFERLSLSGGFAPEIYELTEGSYRLAYFADETDEIGAEALDAIENYTWDYVVMQEQSGISAFGQEVMFPAARTLDNKVRAGGGQSVFLMTWAYKDGVSRKLLGSEFGNTREEMQTLMAENYLNISKERNALLAPAGIAFMRCANTNPDIELWDADRTHPSMAGTYLAACTLYKVLYEQSPEGLSYPEELDGFTALKLQKIAAGMN